MSQAERRQWWIENKHSGKGSPFAGSFGAACRAAAELCNTDASTECVWEADKPSNRKVAEVTLRGVSWRHRDYVNCYE